MKRYRQSQGMCEWEALDEWRATIRAILASEEAGRVSPFLLLALPEISALEQRHCSDLWLQGRIAASAVERAGLDFHFAPATHGKIRLGYLSSDFHEHATSLLLIELLEAHDRERFEVYAYSYGDDDGLAMRGRLAHTFDRFVDIRALSLAEAAQAIHADEVDILIDLKGYTHGSRTEILSYRPAPVQVNYLGYPGTLGGDFCDYLITDRYLTPPASAADYSESFAYLPDSYQPHGRLCPVGMAPSRQAAGLPAEGVVFCCFNQAYKITPEVFNVWCRLLYDVPGSVLWLLASPQAAGNLLSAARQCGIGAERLVFAPDLPQIEHLGRLQLADLVLDTMPCNAHTTASDALWVGVPIITCAGETFAARVAGSVLTAIGLPELIAADLDEYYELALQLASEPESLRQLKAKLAANRLTTPLFDIAAYTRHLEDLYVAMWQRHTAGQAPAVLG